MAGTKAFDLFNALVQAGYRATLKADPVAHRDYKVSLYRVEVHEGVLDTEEIKGLLTIASEHGWRAVLDSGGWRFYLGRDVPHVSVVSVPPRPWKE